MGDTLKRKLIVADITITHCDIQDLIKNGMQHVLQDKKLMELAAQGMTRRYWVEEGLLLNVGQSAYVPNF